MDPLTASGEGTTRSKSSAVETNTRRPVNTSQYANVLFLYLLTNRINANKHNDAELTISQTEFGEHTDKSTKESDESPTQPPFQQSEILDIMFDSDNALTELNDDYFTNSDSLSDEPDPELIEFNTKIIRGQFAGRDPTSGRFWSTVWDEANLSKTSPIYRDHLPDAIRFGVDLREQQAVDAIRLGVVSQQLLPFGDDALRRPGPRDSPENHLSDDEITQFQRWNTWKSIWGSMSDSETDSVNTAMLTTSLQAFHEVDQQEGEAAIGTGIEVGVLVEKGKKIKLGVRRLPAFWKQLLNKIGRDAGSPVAQIKIEVGLKGTYSLTDEETTSTIERGLKDNILYQRADSNDLIVNSPRNEGGPTIADEAFDPDRYPATDTTAPSKSSEDDNDDDPGSGPPHNTATTDSETQPASLPGPANNPTTDASTNTGGQTPSSSSSSNPTNSNQKLSATQSQSQAESATPVEYDTIISQETSTHALAGVLAAAIEANLSPSLKTNLTTPIATPILTAVTDECADEHADEISSVLNNTITDAFPDALLPTTSSKLSDSVASDVSQAIATEITPNLPTEISEQGSTELQASIPDTIVRHVADELPFEIASEYDDKMATAVATHISRDLSDELIHAASDELSSEITPQLTQQLTDVVDAEMSFDQARPVASEITDTIAIKTVTRLVCNHLLVRQEDITTKLSDSVSDRVTSTAAVQAGQSLISEISPQITRELALELTRAQTNIRSSLFESFVSVLTREAIQASDNEDPSDTTPSTAQQAAQEADRDESSTEKTQTTIKDLNDSESTAGDAQDDATTPEQEGDRSEPEASPNTIIRDTDPETLRLSPTPNRDAVQACLEAAADFFHHQLDTTIERSVEFNQTVATDHGYQLPETPRDYFTTPTDSAPAYAVTSSATAESDVKLTDELTAEVAADAATAKSLLDTDAQYRYLGTDHRGWTDEIVNEKRLGWAPTDQTALYEHLTNRGFADETLVATGLFSSSGSRGTHPAYGESENGEEYMDFTRVDDSDTEPLHCFFIGRYVFPYTDENGQITFFIGRRPGFDTEHGTHPDDFITSKYVKLASTKNYTIVDEPIYGRETVVESEPLVITEGIADAITAHAHGIPCVSPVTTQFKTTHQPVLTEIVTENAIPAVYFLQDSDPVSATSSDAQQYDEQTLTRQMALREIFVTGSLPGSDSFTRDAVRNAAATGSLDELLADEKLMISPPADPDADSTAETRVTADEVPLHLFDESTENAGPGPIGAALTITQHGPGMEGAAAMGVLLDETTPSRDGTLTGVGSAAATLYENRVVDNDSNTPSLPSDPAARRDLVHDQLTTVGEDGEPDQNTPDSANTTTTTKTEAARSTQEAVRIEDDDNYDGTDVWLLEMPQLAAVKRDLDDYLQDGWLGLIPPAEWALQTTVGPLTSSNNGSAWLNSLADETADINTYPSRFKPSQFRYPPANDLAATVGAVPRDSGKQSPAVYTPYRVDDPAASHHRHATPTELRKRGQLLEPIPEVAQTYPPMNLFGLLPRIHPSEHPAARTTTSTRVGTNNELDVDPDEIDNRLDADAEFTELTGKFNPLWKATLRDLGLSPGSRGKNPLGHYGESENYFVVISDELAYCHKRKSLYNFAHYALCDAGERDPSDSVTGTQLSDEEYYKLWKYAYEKSAVPKETPIPLDGLKWYTINHGFMSAEEYREYNETDGDEEESGGLPFPTSVYRDVLQDIKNRTGLEPPQLTAIQDTNSTTGADSRQPADAPDLEEVYSQIRYLTDEKHGDMLAQFTRGHLNRERGEVTTDRDETMFAPKTDIRDAYNSWVKIIMEHEGKETDEYPDHLNMEPYSPAKFTIVLNNQLDVELKDARIRIGGELTWVWFGIELSEEGKRIYEEAKRLNLQ